MHIFLPGDWGRRGDIKDKKKKKKERMKRWMGVNVVYTHIRLRGGGCSGSSKGQKAAGLGQKAGSAGG